MEDNKNNKFVGLERSRELRAYNLSAVKDVIVGSKSYFKLKILRDQKLKIISNIKKESKELQLLFNKLYEVLPEHEILELKKKKSSKKKSSKKKTSSKKKKKAPIKHSAESEIDKLQKSLEMIEEKLKTI
jgi:hypothetical protein